MQGTRHEPLHMKPAPTAFRIFRAVMVAITVALLLIASALALVIADIAMGRMVAGMGW